MSLLLGVILSRVPVEPNYPRPSREAAEAFGGGSQARQALLQLPGDGIQVVEHPVRELFFTHLIPHMFLRVQFGGIGW
jgi:hypothetical protein